MWDWSLGLFKCPVSSQALSLIVFEEDNQRIKNGLLLSQDRSNIYPVIDYIPRFVSPAFYVIDDFLGRFGDRIKETGLEILLQEEINKLKRDTNEHFGWEWQEYKKWGWQETVPDLDMASDKGVDHAGTREKTEQAFWQKSLFAREDLEGKLILDAGCGNGRYSYQAYMNGGRVVGVDLGEGAVKAALENTFAIGDIQIVQGDLLAPPFKEGVFDSVFSIGVLMHTGNTGKAIDAIAACVKEKGVFTVHVYRRGNAIVEFNDFLIRGFNKLLGLQWKIKFARMMANISQLLSRIDFRKRPLSWWLNHFVMLRNTHHQMIDWWSAPVASHHTYSEIEGRMTKNELQIIGTGRKVYGGFSKYFPPIGAVTIKGRKNG